MRDRNFEGAISYLRFFVIVKSPWLAAIQGPYTSGKAEHRKDTGVRESLA